MDIATLPNDVDELKAIISGLQPLREENEKLREENKYLRAFLYAHKSEKWTKEDEKQSWLFNEAEATLVLSVNTVTVVSHTKRKGGRKPLSDKLPRHIVEHDLPASEKICACGRDLVKIGEDSREELEYIPARAYVNRHVYHKYVCSECNGTDGTKVKTAAREKPLIARSFATSGLLSYLIVSKFADHLPFYRLERIFGRLGVELPRATMSNWTIHVGLRLRRMLVVMRNDMMAGNLIHFDETPFQVLNEQDRLNTQKSYLWLARGGPPGRPALIYKYNPTRSGDVPNRFIRRSFCGVLLTDCYAGYNTVIRRPSVTGAACWAHVRRKFKVAYDSSKSENSSGALDMIQKLYRIETEIREDNRSADIRSIRNERSRPLVNEFFDFLTKLKNSVVHSLYFGEALSYALDHRQKLLVFLDHPHVPIDNNLAENAIRPFVLGRKNWLFAGSPRGAVASTAHYSILQTAVANGLDPYWYLRLILDRLPDLKSYDDFAQLAPHRIDPRLINEFRAGFN